MSSAFDSIYLGGSSQDDFPDFGEPLSTDFTAVYDSFDSQPATISPHDLWFDDAVMSAPPSTAFPNLGTPSSEYLQSPGLSSGLNTTPMDDGGLDATLDFDELNALQPLFPNESCDQFTMASPAIVSNNSFDSLTDARSPSQPSPMVRQKSSPGRPPITAASHLRKHSQANGINKSSTNKSRKILPEISIDSEDDKDTAKRKKNTAAARKSRERKQHIMESYATEIQRLRALVVSLGGNPDTSLD